MPKRVEPYLGDVPDWQPQTIYKPYRPSRSRWIETGTSTIVVWFGGAVALLLVILAVALALMFAAQPSLAQGQSDELQVRSDCRSDALRHCPADVARYMAAPTPERRSAIIACMLLNRERLQPKCSRHLY